MFRALGACPTSTAPVPLVPFAARCPQVLKRMSPMVGSRLSITEEQDPSLLVYADDSRLYQTVRELEGGRAGMRLRLVPAGWVAL